MIVEIVLAVVSLVLLFTLAKLLEAGEPELGGQLGAAEVLRPAAVQGDVEVEPGRRLRGC